MKNFEQILSEAGVELTDEQKTAVQKEMDENYKTVNDWQKQHDKVKNLEDTLRNTQEKLSAFGDVDVEKLNTEIEKLKNEMEEKEKTYQNQMAERDFRDVLKDSITKMHGKNSRAIEALLDIETLKASKNQKEDMLAALKTLSEAEDSKMLFGDEHEVGTGIIPGTVLKGGDNGMDDRLRAAMGLPAKKE